MYGINKHLKEFKIRILLKKNKLKVKKRNFPIKLYNKRFI